MRRESLSTRLTVRLLAVGAAVPRSGVGAILCAAGDARLGGAPTERGGGPTLGGPTLPGPALDFGASRLAAGEIGESPGLICCDGAWPGWWLLLPLPGGWEKELEPLGAVPLLGPTPAVLEPLALLPQKSECLAVLGCFQTA